MIAFLGIAITSRACLRNKLLQRSERPGGRRDYWLLLLIALPPTKLCEDRHTTFTNNIRSLLGPNKKLKAQAAGKEYCCCRCYCQYLPQACAMMDLLYVAIQQEMASWLITGLSEEQEKKEEQQKERDEEPPRNKKKGCERLVPWSLWTVGWHALEAKDWLLICIL